MPIPPPDDDVVHTASTSTHAMNGDMDMDVAALQQQDSAVGMDSDDVPPTTPVKHIGGIRKRTALRRQSTTFAGRRVSQLLRSTLASTVASPEPPKTPRSSVVHVLRKELEEKDGLIENLRMRLKEQRGVTQFVEMEKDALEASMREAEARRVASRVVQETQTEADKLVDMNIQTDPDADLERVGEMDALVVAANLARDRAREEREALAHAYEEVRNEFDAAKGDAMRYKELCHRMEGELDGRDKAMRELNEEYRKVATEHTKACLDLDEVREKAREYESVLDEIKAELASASAAANKEKARANRAEAALSELEITEGELKHQVEQLKEQLVVKEKEVEMAKKDARLHADRAADLEVDRATWEDRALVAIKESESSKRQTFEEQEARRKLEEELEQMRALHAGQGLEELEQEITMLSAGIGGGDRSFMAEMNGLGELDAFGDVLGDLQSPEISTPRIRTPSMMPRTVGAVPLRGQAFSSPAYLGEELDEEDTRRGLRRRGSRRRVASQDLQPTPAWATSRRNRSKNSVHSLVLETSSYPGPAEPTLDQDMLVLNPIQSMEVADSPLGFVSELRHVGDVSRTPSRMSSRGKKTGSADYDAIVCERDALKSSLEAAENALATTHERVKQMEEEMDATKDHLDQAAQQYAELEAQYGALQELASTNEDLLRRNEQLLKELAETTSEIAAKNELVESTRVEAEQLRRDIAALTVERDTTLAMLSEIQERLHSAEASREEALASVRDLGEKTQRLEADLIDLDAKFIEKEGTVVSVLAEIERLRCDNERLQSEIATASMQNRDRPQYVEEMEEMQKKLDTSEQELLSLRAASSNVERKLGQLALKLEESERRAGEWERKYSADNQSWSEEKATLASQSEAYWSDKVTLLEKAKKDLEEAVSELSDKVKSLMEEVSTLVQERDVAVQAMNDSLEKAVKEDDARVAQVREAHLAEVDELRRQVIDAESMASTLRQQMADMKLSADRDFSQRDDELETLREKVAELTIERDELCAKEAYLDANFNSTQLKLDALRKETSAMEVEISKLQSELNAANDAALEKETAVTDLQSEVGRLMSGLSRVEEEKVKIQEAHKDEIAQMEENHRILFVELADVKSHLEEKRLELQQANERYGLLVSAKDGLEQSFEDLRKSHAVERNELENRLAATLCDLDAKRSEIDVLNDRIRDLELELISTSSSKSSLQREVEDARERARKDADKAESLRVEVDRLREIIEKHEEKDSEILSGQVHEKERLEQELESLRIREASLIASVDEQLNEITRLESEFGDLQRKFKGVDADKEEISQKLLEAEQRYEVERTRLQADLDAVNARLEEAEIKLEETQSGMQSTIRSLEKEKSDLSQKLDESNQQIGELTADLVSRKNEILALTEASAEITMRLANMEQSKAAEIDNIQKVAHDRALVLEKELAEVKKKLKSRDDAIHSLEQQLTAKKEEASGDESEEDSRADDVLKMKREVKSLRSQIETLQSKLEVCQRQIKKCKLEHSKHSAPGSPSLQGNGLGRTRKNEAAHDVDRNDSQDSSATRGGKRARPVLESPPPQPALRSRRRHERSHEPSPRKQMPDENAENIEHKRTLRRRATAKVDESAGSKAGSAVEEKAKNGTPTSTSQRVVSRRALRSRDNV